MSSRSSLSEGDHQRLRARYQRRRSLVALAFLAPNLIFFAAFLVVPICFLFWQTFNTGGVMSPMKFVGLANWRRTFADPLVVQSVRNTVIYSLMAIPAVFVLAMIVALSLRVVERGNTLFKAIIYFPTLQPMLIAALMWTFVLHPDFGALNMLIRVFTGTPVNFLGDPKLALSTIAMVEVWKGLGFWALLFLAGLAAQPTELFQAAELDGAGPLRRFWQHALPLMKPTFFFSVIFATIVNLQLFDSVFVLTDGGPVNSTVTTTWYVYRSLFTFNEPGYGATLAFVLVAIVLALTGLQTLLLKGGK